MDRLDCVLVFIVGSILYLLAEEWLTDFWQKKFGTPSGKNKHAK